MLTYLIRKYDIFLTKDKISYVTKIGNLDIVEKSLSVSPAKSSSVTHNKLKWIIMEA